MIAAVTNECGSDTWHNDTNATLGDLIDAAGGTWAQYAESLPANACPHPGSATAGLFAVRHTPFLFFRDVLKNQTFCHQHVLDAKNFNSSVANGTLPSFSLYTPNLCDDGHTGCGGNTTGAQLTAQADLWLNDFLSPILNHTGRYASLAEQKLVKHTLFMVTWDEGTTNGGFAVANISLFDNYAWCQLNGATGLAVCGGSIYTAFISPYCLHTSFGANASFYNLARTVEWLLHLPHLGNAGAFDNRAAFPVMRSMFTFRSNRA
ncbi:MAG: alkaline phosphatase family protein, partial [Thermoplasmata archaeon]|nr:alkaline phosphatase family protein [Thermoplasmata archaeon]